MDRASDEFIKKLYNASKKARNRYFAKLQYRPLTDEEAEYYHDVYRRLIFMLWDNIRVNDL